MISNMYIQDAQRAVAVAKKSTYDTGGRTRSEGNVLVGGRPVCDDGWGDNEADVACRLGPVLFVYDSFSDVGENRVYFASKILTPCRMH